MKNILIQTKNLILREAYPGDAYSFEEIGQEIRECKKNRAYYALEEEGHGLKLLRETLDQQKVNPRKTIALVIAEKKRPDKMIGFLVGEVGPLDDPLWTGQDELIDLGYFLKPNIQGKGYATEAVRGFVSKIFFEKLQYTHVNASVHPENPASQHVLKALGFTHYANGAKIIKRNGVDIEEDRMLFKVNRDDFYEHKNDMGENKNLIISRQTRIVKGLLQQTMHERGS